MQFLVLQNAEFYYLSSGDVVSGSTDAGPPTPTPGYEPVSNAIVACTTRITRHCVCSNSQNVYETLDV
jgi:hypothetical protein